MKFSALKKFKAIYAVATHHQLGDEHRKMKPCIVKVTDIPMEVEEVSGSSVSQLVVHKPMIYSGILSLIVCQ